MVGSVKVNARVLEDPKDIKEAAVEHFSNNFKEERVIRPVLGGVFHRRLTSAASLQLGIPFHEREIVEALKECSNLKAPGPDGFNFSFVKKGWEFMKRLVLKKFSEFHANGKLTKGINSTFVALIPKYGGLGPREKNIVKGVRIGTNRAFVSHLQFADDTILFCNNNIEEMANIKRILRCFQFMSRLKINFSKSSLCGINVPHQDVISLAQVMGCKVDHLPIKYLGLPLGANPNRIKTWDPVVEKMGKRLSVWRRRSNSTGGRLTLLNHSLSNLPIYFMSIYKMPVAVAKAIEKL
ncbi:uncharacterized protein LOC131317276 [Rhododendron vialii]|uniref:uncharacterized protein LOC131317276 n=1 Tax=Rhododendron vialii TaxID=182163 RepID=UPI00265DC0C3|nr:uncharacterized protein LOC131317276 [Rhododendron vialii]